MGKKTMSWKTKGMNRDLSVSAFNPEFSFENMNLRLSTNEGNTAMSWVTEKGTLPMPMQKVNGNSLVTITSLEGEVIGTAVIDNILVLFATTAHDADDTIGIDYIYKITVNEDNTGLIVTLFFKGNIKFDEEHPLETLTFYESNTLKKVYWVDGKNPLRMLNIEDEPIGNVYSQASSYVDVFNILPSLKLLEEVSVSKITGGSGKFPAGVIQYAFTYYKKNGCESNIFFISSLRYISPVDRGGAPDEMVDNAFSITVNKVDQNFDYLRIYSIERTSLNGTPICKRVVDIDIIKDSEHDVSITYTDTGIVGEVIDPTELLYKNREAIIAKTLEQKDGTLFLGNIKRNRTIIPHVTNHTLEQEETAGGDTTYSLTVTSDDGRYLIMGNPQSSSSYSYTNQLSLSSNLTLAHEVGVPCSGFKIGNTYRLGIQLQDKTGRWSDPIFLQDFEAMNKTGDPARQLVPFHASIKVSSGQQRLYLPRIKCELGSTFGADFVTSDYRKIRPVMVMPTNQDRKVICQGVTCPTVYTYNNRANKSCYAQASWFFRPILKSGLTTYSKITTSGTCLTSPKANQLIPYVGRTQAFNPQSQASSPDSDIQLDLKSVEIQGYFDSDNRFLVDWSLISLHSPDIDFSDDANSLSFNNISYSHVGDANFTNVLSDIDIQTTTPQIDGTSKGFIHKNNAERENDSYGFISGLFYEDFIVYDESQNKIIPYKDGTVNKERSSCKWLVYPWHRSGSINNDFNRPSGTGVQSAVLKKKVISNLRFTNTEYWEFNYKGSVATYADLSNILDPQINDAWNVETVSDEPPVNNRLYIWTGDNGWQPLYSIKYYETITVSKAPSVFLKDTVGIQKIKTASEDSIYQGNVDTLLSPDNTCPLFFALNGNFNEVVNTDFNSRSYWKSWQKDAESGGDVAVPHGIYRYTNGKWGTNSTAQNPVPDSSEIGGNYLETVKNNDSVRMRYKSSSHLVISDPTSIISHFPYYQKNSFYLPIYDIIKNTSSDAYYGGTSIDSLKADTWIVCGEPCSLCNGGAGKTVFYFDYGDMYYQRYDCLKTYAYSPDDINQVVEIGSFMLETFMNIDGRYDKNRGQINNLNMSPENFNLINPVYSQPNNFFSYKIVDENTDITNHYINYITWSFPKTSGEDVDKWTYFTLANTLELEGNKGQLNAIKKYNNQLIAFQDSAVAQILYNESMQISSTAGVPVEIANSGKVDGFRYLSNTIGCSNKFSIVESPAGLYFMDSINKSIYLFNGQFTDISTGGGFNSWSKQLIPGPRCDWTPFFKAYPLQFSSTAFMYPFVGYYDKLNQEVLYINKDVAIAWNEKVRAFTSFYNYEGTPYFTTLGDFQLWLKYGDATGFTRITTVWQHQVGNCCEFFGELKPYWMTLIGNPEPQTDKTFTNLEFRACVEGDGEYDESTGKFTPTLPFDTLEVWDEYQHGIAILENESGHDLSIHHSVNDNNTSLIRKFRMWRCDIPRDNAAVDSTNEPLMGISRTRSHPLDRMRNPWLYLKIKRSPLITYTCIKIGTARGFLIPKTEFSQYGIETGQQTCSILTTNGYHTNTDVTYYLVDTTNNYEVKLTLSNAHYNSLPLAAVSITEILTLATTNNADALFIDCGTNRFTASTELTIGRTSDLQRTEIHDLTMTYFN